MLPLCSSRYCTAAAGRSRPPSLCRKLLEDLEYPFGRLCSSLSIITSIYSGLHAVPFPSTFWNWPLAILHSLPVGGDTQITSLHRPQHTKNFAGYRVPWTIGVSCHRAVSRLPCLSYHPHVDYTEKTQPFLARRVARMPDCIHQHMYSWSQFNSMASLHKSLAVSGVFGHPRCQIARRDIPSSAGWVPGCTVAAVENRTDGVKLSTWEQTRSSRIWLQDAFSVLR